MARKLVIIFSFLAILAIPLQAAPLIFDDFNQHIWSDPGWGWPGSGNWSRKTIISWANAHGSDCLKVTTVGTENMEIFFGCPSFPKEDWSNVAFAKARVYLECNVLGTNIDLETKTYPDATIQRVSATAAVSTNTWTDVIWVPNTSTTKVTHIFLHCTSLGTNETTYYFDDMRLVLNDGTTWYWDDFNRTPRSYTYNGAYIDWNSGSGVWASNALSHNASSATANAGSIYLNWNYTGGLDYAEMGVDPVSPALDLSAYDSVRADVWCQPDVWTSTTVVRPKIFFWYGNLGAESYGQNAYALVTSTRSWQTLVWSLPAGTTNQVTAVKPGIGDLQLMPGGTIYIDNIIFFKSGFVVTKSTNIAKGKPGDPVTITVNYSNTGDMDKSNVYITEVLPFNAVLSGSASGGDDVKYYYSGAWQAAADARATKIRWRINSVATSGTGSVSYDISIK
jgi:uncharacterized repeat protein (TIGR01451 family)